MVVFLSLYPMLVNWLQLVTCCLLSMGHAAGTVEIAANCFTTMLHIYKTEEVHGSAEIILRLRLIGAVGMALGILVGGWRLVPVSGRVCMAQLSVQQRLCSMGCHGAVIVSTSLSCLHTSIQLVYDFR